MVEKLPFDMIERPKMPRATWDALRAHIVRERLRKKQEHEQNQEFERQKMEREHKKKQEALTLEETKQQITNFETKLTQLKEEKHQLFNTLKKVLYEDEHRRRSKEVHQPGLQYLQPTARTPSGGGGHGAHAHGAHASTMYMKPHPQMLMQGTSSGQGLVSQQPASAASAAQASALAAGVKRQRSPSPPRTTGQTLVGLPTSYYRNASGKYVTATTGNTAATSIYSTTVSAGSSTSGLAPHYSAYPGGAVLSGTTTAGGQMPLSAASLTSSNRTSTSSLATVTDARTQNMLSQAAAQVIHQTTGHPSITLPTSTTVQVGGIGAGQRSSSSAYVTSLAAASAAERDRQALAQHSVVNHAQAQAAQAAAVLQAQQRQQSAAAAAMQIAAAAVGQPPPAAHGGSQPSSGNPGTPSSFRAGSIMTGYPRYQQPPITTVGSGGPVVFTTSNLSVNRNSILTAPPSIRGTTSGSSGSAQSTQPSNSAPPGHGQANSARFYQREV